MNDARRLFRTLVALLAFNAFLPAAATQHVSGSALLLWDPPVGHARAFAEPSLLAPPTPIPSHGELRAESGIDVGLAPPLSPLRDQPPSPPSADGTSDAAAPRAMYPAPDEPPSPPSPLHPPQRPPPGRDSPRPDEPPATGAPPTSEPPAPAQPPSDAPGAPPSGSAPHEPVSPPTSGHPTPAPLANDDSIIVGAWLNGSGAALLLA